MRKIFKFKYPKLALFLFVIVLAYILFTNSYFGGFISKFIGLGYFGIFLAGILLALGFTAPLAIGFFIFLNPSNILLAAILGAAGAMISDLLIFKLVKISFMDEYITLSKTKNFRFFKRKINNNLSHKIKIYLMYVFAEIIIASPLPDEIGVSMLAGLTSVKEKIFVIMSFFLHFAGILVLLLL